MFKRIKKIWNSPSFSATLTIIFFIVLGVWIFVVFNDAQIFKNRVLNITILIILSVGIYYLFIAIIRKSIKLLFLKNPLSEKEFNDLWKQRQNLANQIKKEKYNSKNYKRLWNKIEGITKKLDESSIKIKNEILFVTFSFYFGLLEGLPFWAIKQSIKQIWKSLKTIFRPYKIGFRWYKIGDKHYYMDSFVYTK